MNKYQTVELTENGVKLLDQRKLPHQIVYCEYSDYQEVASAIKDMVVRGAPAIGVTAAFAIAHTARLMSSVPIQVLREKLEQASEVLHSARPTAVNLGWAIKRMMQRLEGTASSRSEEIARNLLEEAQNIAREDVETNKKIGFNALPLVVQGANILHHCNTGSLATVDYGTALGVIRVAHEEGRCVHAFLDETRPRFQGASLSAWELKQLGIPHTVIVDSASGFLMRTRKINFCVVGCDRVAANGDVANKIGTYNLALVAKAHRVPFYVAAPTSTIDLKTPCGDAIEIEERSPSEITHVGSTQITPEGTQVLNPAFDVTPAELITGIITERGILSEPYTAAIAKIVGNST